ncbi:MAG: adenine phosphoribosyltransferase [Spirochaetaceae bacterium]|jgi:adenine phosphoribosyltransferase|nr:adenine phosphoribosyltransferase [Spirochaetaceae bacterium]
MSLENLNLNDYIRKVQDFPKKGVLFYDITSILTSPAAFAWCIEKMAEIYADKKLAAIAAIEARGFVFAAPFAAKIGAPLILIRKKGKLPGVTARKSYSLEYGSAEIEIIPEDVPKGGNVLLMDDLIATGGTLKAAKDLLTESGALVTDIFGVIGLSFFPYKDSLSGVNVTTLINYDSE